VWGPCDGPSQFPFLKESPSRWPRARGAGPHECGGRARTASRRAPQCGARVLPRSSQAGAAPDRGGAPAGARGYAASPCGGHSGGGLGRGRVSERARYPCPAGQHGGAQYGAPAALPEGLPCGPSPVESRPGGVARGAGLRGPVGGTRTRPQELIQRGGRRGTDGAAVYYRPPPFPRSLFELRPPPRPFVLIAPPFPFPSPSSPSLLGRGGYCFLAVDGSGAD